MLDERPFFFVFKILLYICLVPVIAYFINLQDNLTSLFVSVGIGELDAKIVVYYLSMFIGGILGYFGGWYNYKEK